jgi:hypothetical protein
VLGFFYRQQNGRSQGMCNYRTIGKKDVDSQTDIHIDSSHNTQYCEKSQCPHKEKSHGARTLQLEDQEHQMPSSVPCRICCTVFFGCSSCSG